MIKYVGLNNLIPPQVIALLTQDVADIILGDLAAKARYEWTRLAGLYLRTSRGDYIRGIQAPELTPGRATISLVGTLPNLVERGMARTDMRDTLLGPSVPTVPVGQRGKHLSESGSLYRAIPFRHATPTSGFTGGIPMGKAYGGATTADDAKRLGRKVYREARKLAPSTSMPGQGTKWGERLQSGLATKLKEYHSTDIYAGMVHFAKTYRRANQGQYMTFRTISTNSDAQKWIRANTRPGKQLAQRVGDYIQRLAPTSFQAYVEGLLK